MYVSVFSVASSFGIEVPVVRTERTSERDMPWQKVRNNQTACFGSVAQSASARNEIFVHASRSVWNRVLFFESVEHQPSLQCYKQCRCRHFNLKWHYLLANNAVLVICTPCGQHTIWSSRSGVEMGSLVLETALGQPSRGSSLTVVKTYIHNCAQEKKSGH